MELLSSVLVTRSCFYLPSSELLVCVDLLLPLLHHFCLNVEEESGRQNKRNIQDACMVAKVNNHNLYIPQFILHCNQFYTIV